MAYFRTDGVLDAWGKKHSAYRKGKRYFNEFPVRHQRGCRGKLIFKKLSAAENHILRQFPEDFTLVPYKCPCCNRWHIGHERRGG